MLERKVENDKLVVYITREPLVPLEVKVQYTIFNQNNGSHLAFSMKAKFRNGERNQLRPTPSRLPDWNHFVNGGYLVDGNVYIKIHLLHLKLITETGTIRRIFN